MDHIPRRVITGLPVKQNGIALPNLTRTARANSTASCVIKGHIVAALRRMAEFSSDNHELLMGEGR